MTQDSPSLDALRRDIDRLDDRIHDLLMERVSLAERIAAAKSQDGILLRPGREALVLRRLIGRHAGPFPIVALVRIWREIMGALVGLQQPFSVATCQPERGAGYIELARNHFGVSWPMTINTSPGQVVRMVADAQVSVGVVPIPSAAEAEHWWLSLTSDAGNLPRIVARLPMTVPERAEGPEAFVIACRPHEETGADRSLIAVETAPDLSRDRLRQALSAAGLDVNDVLATHRADDHWIHLVDANGYLTDEDSRLADLVTAKDPVRHTRVIGGYAMALSA